MLYCVTTSQLKSCVDSLSKYGSHLDSEIDVKFEEYKSEVLKMASSIGASWLPWGRVITCPDELEVLESLVDIDSPDFGRFDLLLHVEKTYGFGRSLKLRTKLVGLSDKFWHVKGLLDASNLMRNLCVVAGFDTAFDHVSLNEREFLEYRAALIRYGT